MEREVANDVELKELGIASADTQGSPGPFWEVTGPDRLAGISDE